ncbi:multidrug effflux MFS transporter [Acinetobacter nectaris]|uniref:multidrug effflux MFS transporter n=1 Tax=Acinetobacter nectaris TaxID=1219382 RepID=UPI001F2CBC40|nr:multidrug effflux MFS transporter [Acinetobacter nectaris]MCF8999985.1 multidrug effflux MFS transporter [Acinetobacter nectaris]MCF9028366.1 multidrug effflux MFS transporter [Acinetobacter nectaris]
MENYSNCYLILLITILSMFGLISSDIYVPALPAITHFFAVSEGEITFSISIYLIALAFSQLVYGFLIENFGAKHVLITGIIIYIFSSLACAISNTYHLFIIFRLIQGIGAASGLVIGRYIISICFPKEKSAYIYAIIYPFVSLSPAIAPLIGGYLSTYFHWQSNFIFIAIFGLFALFLTYKILPISFSQQPSSRQKTKVCLKESISILFKDINFWIYTCIVCFIYQAWFIYLTQSTFIFKNIYFLSAKQAGWLYLPLSFGIIIANYSTRKLLRFWNSDHIILFGLISFFIGGILFIYPRPSLAYFILSMFIVSLANGSSLSLAVAAAINSKHNQTAIASGILGFLQIGSAGIISYLISHIFGQNIETLGHSIFVLSSLSVILFIFKLYKYKSFFL